MKHCKAHNEKQIAVLCKGSTADSDSVCRGSNPCTAVADGMIPSAFVFSLAFSAYLWYHSLYLRYIRKTPDNTALPHSFGQLYPVPFCRISE